jgi:hypothetical protein
MAEYVADCLDCEWEQAMPTRETAEHAKRVHEDQYGHNVSIEQ